jgi:hypothetical protein
LLVLDEKAPPGAALAGAADGCAAYAHFILENQLSIPQPERPSEPRSLTRQVLRYAAAAE